MEIKIKNPSLALLIIVIVFYIFYKKILDPISENVMKKRYLLENFEGVVKTVYFDSLSRNRRYLVLDNGTVLSIDNPFYRNSIKVGQHIKKEFEDSIIYIDNIKFNYLKEE